MEPCYACAAGGDPAARQSVVEALRPRMVRMAAYYARRTGEDEDDLLQEAWVGVLDALPNLDVRIGSPEQHLLKQARWRLLDAVKRARVRHCLPLDAAPERQSHPLEAHASACTAEFTRRLKPSQRAILRCLLDGLTWRETGEMLGCSSPNVAYHVRQIRRHYAEWTEA